MAALAATASFAQSSVTIYGNLDLGTYQSKTNGRSALTAASNSGSTSLWGISGVEDLGGGTKASFDLKSEINMLSGNTGSTSTGIAGTNTATASLFNRGANMDLSNAALGSVKIGRQNDAWWESQGALNTSGLNSFGFGNMTAAQTTVVNTGYGNPLNGNSVAAGTAGNSGGLSYLGTATSTTAATGLTNPTYQGVGNAFIGGVSYTAPTIFGVTAKVQSTAGKVSYVDGLSYNAGGAYSLNYAQGPLKLVYAYNFRNDYNGDTAMTNTAIGGTYTMGAYTFIAAQNKAKYKATAIAFNDTTATGLGVSYAMSGALTLNLSWAQLKDDEVTTNKATTTAVTARYNLSKRTQIYGGYGSNKNEGLSRVTPVYGGTGAPATDATYNGQTVSALLFGLRHQF